MAKAALDKAMGIPVGIDVTRYVAAEQTGKSAQEARQDAAVVQEASEVPVMEDAVPPVTIDLENSEYKPAPKVEETKDDGNYFVVTDEKVNSDQ